MKIHKSFIKNKKKSSITQTAFWGVFSAIIWELAEELLENLIAQTLTNFLVMFTAKLLSILAIITLTKSIKYFMQRSLSPIVKSITFKEGNDKMEKIKNIFKFIYRNKCSLGGILLAGITAFSGTDIIDINGLPAIYVEGFNITPVIYYSILGAGIMICSIFFENEQEFTERVKKLADSKLAKQIEKAVQKKLADEQKATEEEKIKEEKQTKAELKKQIKADKEKAFNDLVDARIKELTAQAENKKDDQSIIN